MKNNKPIENINISENNKEQNINFMKDKIFLTITLTAFLIITAIFIFMLIIK